MSIPDGISPAYALEDGQQLRVQVAIVGLGAGGGMAFHDLSLAGLDVLALEAGERFEPGEATGREEQMLPKLFMDAGARATEDMAITILQGRGVGGSTLHNTNLCKRLPKPILERWADEFGLPELLGQALERDFDDVERLLGVMPVPDDQINPNNALMARGVKALGWAGGRLSHNRQGCQQSGLCELGCPNNGKQNAAKVLVPQGLKANGRVLTHARVERILVRHGQAYGLECQALSADSNRPGSSFTVFAERIILSASATASAALVQRSGLADPHLLAGSNLHLHPGAFVAGIFDSPVYSWRGVPQAQDCTEFLKLGEEDGGAWIVTGAAHPGAAAGLMPGFGQSHGAFMRKYPHVGISITMLHDHASGRVLPGPTGEHVRVHYKLGRSDEENLLRGLKGAAHIMLAAGAEQVMLPLNPVRMIRHVDELEALSVKDISAFSPPLVAVHPMSTLWMGSDARRSVVNARGEHHHVRHLYVADGSLFPTSIGGPPQIPIYTMARQVARHVADSF